MKKISVIRLLAVCMTFCWVSCKAKKTVIDVKVNDTTQQQTVSSKVSSLKMLSFVQKVSDNQLYAKNIVGNMSFTLKTSDRNITTPGMVRMRKDEVIRLQLFIPLIGTEVGRIEFTPDYVLVVDRVHKEYIQADYTQLDFLKKNGLSFYSLQALFWNQLLLPGTQRVSENDLKNFKVDFNDPATYLVSLINGSMSYIWNTDPTTGRIHSADVAYSGGNNGTSKLNWQYSDFRSVGVKNFPATQVFTFYSTAISSRPNIQVSIQMNDVRTDSEWETRTVISDKYKRVELEDVFNRLMNM